MLCPLRVTARGLHTSSWRLTTDSDPTVAYIRRARGASGQTAWRPVSARRYFGEVKPWPAARSDILEDVFPRNKNCISAIHLGGRVINAWCEFGAPSAAPLSCRRKSPAPPARVSRLVLPMFGLTCLLILTVINNPFLQIVHGMWFVYPPW